MAGGSDYIENAILSWLKGTTFPASPATLYVSLHTADPADTGASEVTGGSYARVAVTSSSGWSAVGAGTGTKKRVTNAGVVTFPSPTANWGTVTHFGVWDASTSGNFVVGGALGSSQAINNGDGAPSFAVGVLEINAD